MKLVTVGIPFYNNEKTLSYSIRSTVRQTYSNLEIILVDDGSTDKSLEIAQKFAAQDNRIRIVSDGRNKGLIARLNQIIELSSGEYIARMDADDMMDPERIQQQVELLSNSPTTDVVTTGMASLDNTLTPVGKRCCKVREPVIYSVFKSGKDLLHATMMVRSSWAKANRYLEGFDRAEDRELFTRTIESGKYQIIPEPLYYYLDIQNMTLQKYLKSYRSERKAILKNWRGKITRNQMLGLIIRSIAKSVAIRFYFILGAEERLFRSKNDPLYDHEVQKIKNNIKSFMT